MKQITKCTWICKHLQALSVKMLLLVVMAWPLSVSGCNQHDHVMIWIPQGSCRNKQKCLMLLCVYSKGPSFPMSVPSLRWWSAVCSWFLACLHVWNPPWEIFYNCATLCSDTLCRFESSQAEWPVVEVTVKGPAAGDRIFQIWRAEVGDCGYADDCVLAEHCIFIS